jgi:hypothetical protein
MRGAAYEAAMTENQLLRAVLDDLKGEGCAPRSISNRRKAEFGERLRRETGLPLREITAFLRISKSSYEYQRARLGEDRDAALRGPVREAFEEGRGCYGYRRVNALLRLRGTRVSEKRVRRVMREFCRRRACFRSKCAQSRCSGVILPPEGQFWRDLQHLGPSGDFDVSRAARVAVPLTPWRPCDAAQPAP